MSVVLLMSGCAEYTYNTDMVEKGAAEDAAIEKAEAEALTACAHGQKPQDIPRREYVAYNNCRVGLAKSYVTPVVVFPELLNRFILTATENAEQYAKGEISFELLEAREQVARD